MYINFAYYIERDANLANLLGTPDEHFMKMSQHKQL
jgi:hypothetical protein